ncbi:MAG: magnesium-dependent phosphatase-1 [Thermosphaera sp.]|nr:magnesium-dependent phosphatase-1 [Thermosphaera sp.]
MRVSKPCKVLFIDLDGTLWDHKDVSQMKPPFKRIGEGMIIDSIGTTLKINETMLEILRTIKDEGVLLSTLSWNNPDIALQALEELGLRNFFHYHAIEYHPRKDLMAEKALTFFKESYNCEEFEIAYIDDRDIHLNDLRKKYPETCFIMAWRDFSSISKGVEKVKKCFTKAFP